MNHYLIQIQYDGSAFDGWQRLSNNPKTIQQTIEQVLSKITEENIRITGSGRTDSGVNATAQYADFKCHTILFPNDKSQKSNYCSAAAFLKKCNSILPDTISITDILIVSDNFHTRKNCIQKTYNYYISCSAKPDVFSAKYVYNPASLSIKATELNNIFNHNNSNDSIINYDIDAIKKAANYLIGEHDFSSFTSDKTLGKSHIRRIDNISISFKDTPSKKRILVLSFTGNGFLYNMVRILSGTLLYCGLGIIKPEQIPVIISHKNRSFNPAITLPGNALFLSDVKFK